MRLENKVAIITGGATSIGRACALHFARVDGARVVIADTDQEAGQALVDELGGDRALFVSCDPGKKLDIKNLFAAVMDAFGQVDVLLNAATVHVPKDILQVTEAEFDRVLNVNLRGAFFVAQAAAKHMVEQIEAGREPGVILNLSSINAVVALPDQVPFSISKGGINQMTKSMAIALAPHGIRVNAIGPGSIEQAMITSATFSEEDRSSVLARTPLGRIGSLDEVAQLASFLASKEASYITGQVIYIDGGRLALNMVMPKG